MEGSSLHPGGQPVKPVWTRRCFFPRPPGGFSPYQMATGYLGKESSLPHSFFHSSTGQGGKRPMPDSHKGAYISFSLADNLGNILREVDDAGRLRDQDPAIDDEIEKFSHFLLDLGWVV